MAQVAAGRGLLLLLAVALVLPAAGVRLDRSHPHKHESSHHESHHKKHERSEETAGPKGEAEDDDDAPRPKALTPKDGCVAPQPGDKVVYCIRHEFQNLKLGSDPPILDPLMQNAVMLRMHPKLVAAIHGSERHRAQLVVMSPFTRTMETAILGFGGLFAPDQFLLNPDLMEYQLSDHAQPQNGEAMLLRLNATDILKKYRDLPEGWTDSAGDHVERWQRFGDFLRARPEERFIVVSHHWMMKRAGHALKYGEVGISAITPRGEWKVLSDPSCWPDFKEEYKQIVDDYMKQQAAHH